MTTILRTTADLSEVPGAIFDPPAPEAVSDWFTLGGTLAKSTKNRLNPAVLGSAFGSPTIEASHAHVGPSNYIVSSVQDTAKDVAIMAVARAPLIDPAVTPGVAYIASNFGSPNGIRFYYQTTASTRQLLGVLNTIDGSRTATLNIPTVTDWMCVFLSVDDASLLKVRDLTHNLQATRDLESTRNLAAPSFIIGSNPGSSTNLFLDVATFAIFKTRLPTEDEIQDTYAFLKGSMGRKGISI